MTTPIIPVDCSRCPEGRRSRWLGSAKDWILRGAEFVRLHRMVGADRRSELAILCYHNIVPDSHPLLRCGKEIALSKFRRQVTEIRARRTPVTLDQVEAWAYDSNPLPPNPVLVTFDDGFAGAARLAAPVLESLRIPAVFHLSTVYIGTRRALWTDALWARIMVWNRGWYPSPAGGADLFLGRTLEERCRQARRIVNRSKLLDPSRLREYLRCAFGDDPERALEATDDAANELTAFMSWDEARGLSSPTLAPGSHGVHHWNLATLPASDLEEELRGSKKKIEAELQLPCRSIAYPFGGREHVSRSVFQATRSAGYSVGFTLFAARAPRDPLCLGRMYCSPYDGHGAFSAHLSGLHGFLKRPR